LIKTAKISDTSVGFPANILLLRILLMSHNSRAALDVPVLLGESPLIVALRGDIAVAARTQAKVLILGETGAGKEVVARLVHDQSARRGRPYVAVNCSGIPETLLESELFGHTRGSFTGAIRDKVGLVQQADRGTLFLDELGEMSLRMQAALLRFTESGEIQRVGADGPSIRTDVRLITATNRDLRQRIADGAFREDLYFRLNVIQLEVPPLRMRGGDILLLTQHYLERAAHAHGLSLPVLTSAATDVLMAYSWPGNVRELRNITERLVLQDRRRPVTPDELPREVCVPSSARTATAGSISVPNPRADTSTVLSPSPTANALWDRMQAGEDFWTVVGTAFKARGLTRADLAAIVDRGLRETRGSYRALLRVFHLPPTDYKRLHAFLYQQQCNLPVASYRQPSRRVTGRVESVENDVRYIVAEEAIA
jgi:two-component system, NtrC family, response regulator HydG